MLQVPLEVRLALFEYLRKTVELGDAERAEEVAQSIVVSNLFVLVPGAILARLLRALLGALGDAAIVGDERAAARCRYDLVSVEGVDACESSGTSWLALPLRANGFCRVVDENSVVFAAEARQRREIAP